MAESLRILLGTSACLQWLCHSGERTVAHGPLVFYFFLFFLFLFFYIKLSFAIHEVFVLLKDSLNAHVAFVSAQQKFGLHGCTCSPESLLHNV